MQIPDVLVIGKGPAALAAAAECAGRGLRVAVVGPDAPIHWPARYGAWSTELVRLGLQRLVEHQWSETVVGLDGDAMLLHRGYARVDRDALLSELLRRCEGSGVRWVGGSVGEVRHDDTGSVARLTDGRELRASLVIDASGHRSALVRRASGPPPAYQTAVGLTFRASAHPFAPDRAVLMDWEPASPHDAAGPPTFQYAMPLPDGLLFAEETVLASRPPAASELLERRLRARLARQGVAIGEVVEREVCWIPMGGGLPDLRQRLVGFGGAAGMVHPATGYMLTRVLEAAPRLAACLESALASGTPSGAARSAWRAVWPSDTLARWILFRYGLEVLLRLDRPGLVRFFRSFFSLPAERWEGYLNDRLPLDELAAFMARLFRHSHPVVRAALAGPLLGRAGMYLARDLPPALLRAARAHRTGAGIIFV